MIQTSLLPSDFASPPLPSISTVHGSHWVCMGVIFTLLMLLITVSCFSTVNDKSKLESVVNETS